MQDGADEEGGALDGTTRFSFFFFIEICSRNKTQARTFSATTCSVNVNSRNCRLQREKHANAANGGRAAGARRPRGEASHGTLRATGAREDDGARRVFGGRDARAPRLRQGTGVGGRGRTWVIAVRERGPRACTAGKDPSTLRVAVVAVPGSSQRSVLWGRRGGAASSSCFCRSLLYCVCARVCGVYCRGWGNLRSPLGRGKDREATSSILGAHLANGETKLLLLNKTRSTK